MFNYDRTRREEIRTLKSNTIEFTAQPFLPIKGLSFFNFMILNIYLKVVCRFPTYIMFYLIITYA